MDVAQPVSVEASLLARDPAGLAGAGGDLAVQAHRELGADKGAPRLAVLDIELVEASSTVFVHAQQGFDAPLPELGDSRAADALVGVGHRDDDALHAGQDYGFGARRSAVQVGA